MRFGPVGGGTLDKKVAGSAFAWMAAALAVAVVIAVSVPLFTSQTKHESGPAGTVGEPAPVIRLLDAHGASVSLLQYRGRIVITNLWATWCPPCRAEMPDLQRLWRNERGAVVVVGIDEGESRQRALDFADALGVTYPIWLDESQRYGRALDALGLPTTVILNRGGAIASGFDGALTYGQMKTAIAPLLHH